jgi:hypothetical protein
MKYLAVMAGMPYQNGISSSISSNPVLLLAGALPPDELGANPPSSLSGAS